MNSLVTTGIILRRLEYGEADRIITFLTADYGKLTAIAKGVRKQKSKLAGGVELLSVSELHFIKGRSEMGTLVSTRLNRHFNNIVKDYDRTQTSYRMLKVLFKTLEDGTGQEYYSVLEDSLAALDDTTIPRLLVEHSFDMRLLQLLGHVPTFSTDQTGRKLNMAERYNFDFETVTFAAHPEGAFTQNHIKLMRLLSYNQPQALKVIEGIEEFCKDLSGLVRTMAQQYLPAKTDN
jgi:DNA repair protein RecO (recombination protein O)